MLWKQTINNKYEKKGGQQRKAETETETETEREKEKEENLDILQHKETRLWYGMASTDDNDDGRMREREKYPNRERQQERCTRL